MNAARSWTIRSIVYALVVSLALAVAIFPAEKERPWPAVDPIRVALELASGRYINRSELLRRAHSRVLAGAAIAQTAGTREPIADVRPADVPPVFQERVHASIGWALTTTRHDPNMRVVVTFTVDTGSTLAGVRAWRSYRGIRTDVFPPGSIADGVCTIVARASDPHVLDPGRKRRAGWYYGNDAVSACGWYMAYGTPGRGIAAWLDSTHFDPIKSRSLGTSMRLNSMGEPGTFSFSEPAITACWADRDKACEALVLQTTKPRYTDWSRPTLHTPGWIGEYLWYNDRDIGFARTMLVGLEHELGAEGFAAFWKSNEPLPVAFAAARGESLDSWARRHFPGGPNAYHAGPLPAPRVSIAWLLAVPGLLALGVLAVAKRGAFA